MKKPDPINKDLGLQARKLYEQLRPEIETPERIGQLIVIDVKSGDYEIDDLGIQATYKLKARHPEASLYAFRIGYKVVESFGGVLERTG